MAVANDHPVDDLDMVVLYGIYDIYCFYYIFNIHDIKCIS